MAPAAVHAFARVNISSPFDQHHIAELLRRGVRHRPVERPALFGKQGDGRRELEVRRRRDGGHRGCYCGLGDVLGEEVLKQRPVVVIVVTASIRAAGKTQSSMALPLLSDVSMTELAEVFRHRYAHAAGELRLVLAMARETELGIELLQPVRIARIIELLRRVRVVRELELGAVTSDAALLKRFFPAERRQVTGVAGQLDLVMAAGGLAQEKGPLVTGAEHCC